jgi:hypothetical protein
MLKVRLQHSDLMAPAAYCVPQDLQISSKSQPCTTACRFIQMGGSPMAMQNCKQQQHHQQTFLAPGKLFRLTYQQNATSPLNHLLPATHSALLPLQQILFFPVSAQQQQQLFKQ